MMLKERKLNYAVKQIPSACLPHKDNGIISTAQHYYRSDMLLGCSNEFG